MASSSILTVAWRRYLQQLDQRPLRTKALTAAVLSALSDLLAQRLAGSARTPVNWRRTLAIALYGFLWGGPSAHFWQQFLAGALPNRKRDSSVTAKRVLLDQLSYGPVQNAAFMVFMAKVVEGRSWGATGDKLRKDFGAVQRRGWRVWPLASWVNQQFVPLQLRVVFLNLVALGWTTSLILSSRTAPKLLKAA
ncbi:Peroxisomal membrane PMP22 [Chlorella sorokiniana]|uniref:Peroxisomal membrane PMP22 n=1 Tax=Chlorella sorokiniana TaxID=3076 RepID=A0A2P6TD78_CHLSO|nr:Peroxisomal membrane PMP22 [Chlorella sorokiniana]|eukprot:PRW20594.1 Peroxisomal membrane PMP22 [Chlorella sorokiniana]